MSESANIDAMLAPLRGVRVLDLTQMVAGPFCTMMLAQLGADVVKVEAPTGGDPMRRSGRFPPREAHEDYFDPVNLGKRSIVLNLKDEAHRQAARELAERADVLVENFAPGTATRLGMGWADLQPLNARLLYCSISGFGQTGPESGRLAMDPIIQAVTGMMSVTGTADGDPTQSGAPLADVIAGMYAAYAIVAHLHEVKRSGRGGYLDMSMQAAMLAALSPRMAGALNAGIAPQRIGNQNPLRVPSDVYRTRDGVHVFIMVHDDHVWPPFCRALGRGEWLEDARFSTNRQRCESRAELNAMVIARFAEWDSEEIITRLRAERVPHSIVNDYVRAVADRQAVYRGIVQQVQHPASGAMRVIGLPWLMNGESVHTKPPPVLDQHHADVLREWLG